ncbi:hypothetical protein A3J61_02190 [Candidatus Nomurabacteria bacterium RIFCSPHIGHO2_02_FULL_38_15]|uniref:Metallo-beta-lactamase domain-containing protein n=1 Tax=Candidatus Nomurabacteria bacterium RIFCSPHIGHO2_02_FULL_38_15 TaxID=1801752 RepID=A0A1F6VS67_9BACT|nr:MAG: hypothetical protein A3J61_02190 [Candidatus Nomurabacteria bacterium RIFCSPHIGHO2_02_FULL_38_15]
MKKRLFWLIAMVIIIAAGAFVYLYKPPQKTLKVYFLDVGQGDAIFIKTPSGTTMLIDAGPKDNVLKPLSKNFLFKKKHIDVLLATHPDADHVAGFVPVMKNYSSDVFIESAYEKDNQILSEIHNLINQKVAQHVIATVDTQINLGDGVEFKILSPNNSELDGDSNNASIVGKLIYGDTSFLLTGDASISNEIRLVKDYPSTGSGQVGLKANVLKLGHHGSRTSSSIEFLESVKPDIAIISAGLNNQYGHPHPEVINRLKNLNIPYILTAKVGTICMQSNGQKVSTCN